MARTIAILFLLTIALLPWQLQAQKYQLSDFEETALPKPCSNDWYKFLEGTYDFRVAVKKGKLRITNFDSNDRDRKVELPINRGTLIGTDEGEFGGELTFEADDGRSVVIKEGDFPFLFIYKREAYFIDTFGPFKMGTLDDVPLGALYKLVWQDDGFTYVKIFDFDEFPTGMCMVKDDIMVVSFNYICRIHDLKKEILFKRDAIKCANINSYFTLNSIASTDDQHIYVGAAGGYIQFNLIDKSYKYYKYKK